MADFDYDDELLVLAREQNRTVISEGDRELLDIAEARGPRQPAPQVPRQVNAYGSQQLLLSANPNARVRLITADLEGGGSWVLSGQATSALGGAPTQQTDLDITIGSGGQAMQLRVTCMQGMSLQLPCQKVTVDAVWAANAAGVINPNQNQIVQALVQRGSSNGRGILLQNRQVSTTGTQPAVLLRRIPPFARGVRVQAPFNSIFFSPQTYWTFGSVDVKNGLMLKNIMVTGDWLPVTPGVNWQLVSLPTAVTMINYAGGVGLNFELHWLIEL